MKILLEMRPALDGHAGIPQATRLLFRGLRLIDGLEAEGLIQSSGYVLAKGLPTSTISAAVGAKLWRSLTVSQLREILAGESPRRIADDTRTPTTA